MKELFLNVVWYGMTISEGLRRYQQEKRQHTEDKILVSLLTNGDWSGWRDIWKSTRIYRNNIKPILEKLLKEERIIKLNSVRTFKWYDDKYGYSHKKHMYKTIYLPNVTNPYVYNIIKRDSLYFLDFINYPPRMKATKSYLKLLEEKYGRITVDAFVLERENYYADKNIKMGRWIDDTFYARQIGISLLCIFSGLNQLPK
ncbi:MAG: hypothetical protein ACREAE_04645 [Nitrosopumilaceae archaeon]